MLLSNSNPSNPDTSSTSTQAGKSGPLMPPPTSHLVSVQDHATPFCILESPVTLGSTTAATSAIQGISRYHPVATGTPSPRSVLKQRRRSRLSPATSPHKLGKIGPKRRRTVAVRKLSSQFKETSEQHTLLPSQTSLTSDCFCETSSEIEEKDTLQFKLFSYILQKHIVHHCEVNSRGVLSDVRLFLDKAQICDDQQPSKVYYMELIDENPDTDETMSLIAEDSLISLALNHKMGGLYMYLWEMGKHTSNS